MEPWMNEVGNNGGAGEGCGEGSLAASGGPPLHLHHLDHNPPLSPHDAPPRVPCPPPSRMDAEGEPREGEIGIEQQHTYQQTDRQNRAGPAATASISFIAGTAAAALICVQRWTMAIQSSDAPGASSGLLRCMNATRATQALGRMWRDVLLSLYVFHHARPLYHKTACAVPYFSACRSSWGSGGRRQQPDTRFHLISDTAMCARSMDRADPEMCGWADHELRTAAWRTGELENWRIAGSMELSRASVSALLFGTTTPQDEGGQRCISRQKIKNAGVGLSAQTVDKTDGHGDGQPPRVLGKSTLDSDKLLSLMPSQSPPCCASKHASPGTI